MAPTSQSTLGSAVAAVAYVVVIVAVLAAGFFAQAASVLRCPAADLDSKDYYLIYCQARGYTDYDHGAFWYGIEPDIRESAAAAQVLFIGNSRVEHALSAPPSVSAWFAEHDISYYLMGFTYGENMQFFRPLLRRLHPRARAYVINLDDFFVPDETLPAQEILHSPDSYARYQLKRAWQPLHRMICSKTSICGDRYSMYRRRTTGQWVYLGPRENADILPPTRVRTDVVERAVPLARSFIGELGVPRECVVFIYVPTYNNDPATAQAIADALGYQLHSPRVQPLQTFDYNHLSPESAQRFADALVPEIGPDILRCLSNERHAP